MSPDAYKFHFTTGLGWMNDPNGLIFKDGIYHLYFQYNPSRLDWGNIGWGHAFSKDLIHWTNDGLIFPPDEDGMIFSGSAISVGDEILCYYTEAGKTFSQKLARSSDGGKTLVKDKNFCVPPICKESRDPKVFYHEATSAYIMILWLEENDFGILRSEKADGHFELSQRFTLPGGFECPNLFELDGTWFVWTAHGYYYPGTFDGYTFSWNGKKYEAFADSIPYAAQVFSGTSEQILIPWLRIEDSANPKKWNGIMGIPRRLGLVKKGDDTFISMAPFFSRGTDGKDSDITDANIREYTSDGGTKLHVEVLRQMVQAVNYQKQMDSVLEEIKASGTKPKLLLHACCGPCSTYVIEYLSQYFDITVYFYNPNIHPREEYEKRLESIRRFVTSFPPAVQNQIKFVEETYDVQDYFSATKVLEEIDLQTESERGERCRRCYEFRMKKSWDYAEKNGFDYFTTTISISPCKDAKKINDIGLALKSNVGLKYLVADFKKRNGFLRSLQLSKEYELYRQTYCGCTYSEQNQKSCEKSSDHQCVMAL